MKFTDSTLQALTSTGKRRYIRSEYPGFVLRIQPSGLKTFFVIQTINGKRKHINLGNYPDVSLRDALTAFIKGTIEDANAEVQEEQPEDKEPPGSSNPGSFGRYTKLYLAWSKAKHSEAWHKIIELSLNNDVLPVWSSRPIKGIRRKDCIAVLEAVAARSPGQVANTCKAIQGVFNHALDREAVDQNPALSLSRAVPDLSRRARQRVLSPKEIKHVWEALGSSPVELALKTILVTAQRPGEVAGLVASEIEGNVWTIPAGRAEKGHRNHGVPLTALAKSCIPATGFGITRHALSKYLCRHSYLGLPRWTPHDLRRTARTYFAKLGIPEEHSEAILNHVKVGMAKIYNQWQYQAEKAAALELWSEELQAMIT